MAYKKVVVAGGGVLGSQIAFQSAYCGFDVTIWLRSESSIGRTQPKIDKLKDTYLAEIEAMYKTPMHGALALRIPIISIRMRVSQKLLQHMKI